MKTLFSSPRLYLSGSIYGGAGGGVYGNIIP